MARFKTDYEKLQEGPSGPTLFSGKDFAEARWEALQGFSLDKPSGDITKDLATGKRILLQRGIDIRAALPAPDLGQGIIQFVASSDGVKRDGNAIKNNGWQFENFSKNPVFLWCHDYRSLPIGRHVQWRVDKESDGHVLRIWSQFCDPELYPFADKVRRMYEKGFLRAGSIGWIPLEANPIEDDEGWIVGFEFTKNELLEFSAVPVPADPNAIVEAVGRGLLNQDDLSMVSRYMNLPRDSRPIAYTLSNFNQLRSESEDKPYVSNNTESGSEQDVSEDSSSTEVEAKVPDSDSRVQEEEMDKKEILEAIAQLGERLGVLDQLSDKINESNKLLIEGLANTVGDSIREALATLKQSEEADEVRTEETVTEEAEAVEEAVQEEEKPEITVDIIQASAEGTESRIGASLSKKNQERLASVRTQLANAVSALDELLSTVEEVESETSSAEGASLEQRQEEEEKQNNDDLDARFERLLRTVNGEEATEDETEEEETEEDDAQDDFSRRLDQLAASVRGEKEEVEDIQDYVDSLLKRIKG